MASISFLLNCEINEMQRVMESPEPQTSLKDSIVLQALFQCSHPTMWKFIGGLESDCAQQKAAFLQGVIIQPAVKNINVCEKG